MECGSIHKFSFSFLSKLIEFSTFFLLPMFFLQVRGRVISRDDNLNGKLQDLWLINTSAGKFYSQAGGIPLGQLLLLLVHAQTLSSPQTYRETNPQIMEYRALWCQDDGAVQPIERSWKAEGLYDLSSRLRPIANRWCYELPWICQLNALPICDVSEWRGKSSLDDPTVSIEKSIEIEKHPKFIRKLVVWVTVKLIQAKAKSLWSWTGRVCKIFETCLNAVKDTWG